MSDPAMRIRHGLGEEIHAEDGDGSPRDPFFRLDVKNCCEVWVEPQTPHGATSRLEFSAPQTLEREEKLFSHTDRHLHTPGCSPETEREARKIVCGSPSCVDTNPS